jgi:hypothetical protein
VQICSAGVFSLGLLLAVQSIQPVQAVQTQFQTLRGHVPAAVIGSQPIERLPQDKRLRLAVGLPLRDPAGLKAFLDDLYNPAGPTYHQYLTPDEFTGRFGPTELSYQTVINFLQTNGFSVVASHPNRLIVDVTGSVADIERAFNLKMNVYDHPSEARTYFAPDSEPSLDALVPILSISGLSDYIVPHPALLIQDPAELTNRPVPLGGSGPSGSYRGSDFRAAYAPGIPASLNGSGQSVGLLQFDGYNVSAINAYESAAGLPQVPLINVLLDEVTGAAGGNNIEVALDIEMCVSMAPGLAAIIVYEGNDGNDILNRMATDNVAKQLSASWTFGIDATTEQIFQQFAAQGQSYFNASGDSDAYSGTISTPSDDPFVISVGGTTLTTGAGASYSSETAWNRNNGTGTGGGISTAYAIPTWQQGLNMTVNKGSTTKRNIPDVAMIAENVVVIYNSGTQGFVGGTSIASPLWAAFTALINQQGTLRGKPSVGFLNPAVYALGTNAAAYASAFHDIQTGNNTNSSSPTLFFAVPGYDLCTGWGTPTGTNLINALVPAFNSRIVTNVSATLVTESCPNGVIDPGETVTVNVGLRNMGGVNTTNLVVTLQPTGGVLLPSAAQSYGVLVGGGATVSMPFSFTAGGSCGSIITATFQLQDGPANLGSLTVNFQTGIPVMPLNQNFDGVAAPALPSGWTTAVSAGSNWVTTTANRDSAPNGAFAFEPTNAGVAELISPVVPIVTSSAKLTFRNFYNSECDPAIKTNAYDGGVLEIKIGAGAFTDILSAGGSFAANGYNKKIDPTDDNPLDGRQCWSGLSGGFITTVVNLPAAAAGQNIQLKWRFGTDTANAYGTGGWYIDNVAIQDGFTCCAGTAPSITTQPTNQTTIIGSNVTFTVAAAGSVPLTYQWTFAGTNLPGATATSLLLTSVQPIQAGPYAVVVTNSSGSITSSIATLRVLVAPTINFSASALTATNVSMSVNSVTGLNYTLQYKNNLTDATWISLLPSVVGNGSGILLIDTNNPVLPSRFYRVLCN